MRTTRRVSSSRSRSPSVSREKRSAAPSADDARARARASIRNSAWAGAAKPVPTAVAIGVGLVTHFLIPCPAGVKPQAWQLLAIFLSTVVGLVMEPLPVPAWAFVGLTTAVVTKTLTFQQAFAAFTNDVIWLIALAFFLARGVVKSGLGTRIAQVFICLFGKSTLGLSYGLALAEIVLAGAMPSNTARAGGIFMPVIKSLAENAGSHPDKNPRRLGAFLAMSQCHGASTHTSSLFLTGAAQNLLCVQLARKAGIPFPNPWIQWFTAASVPCLVGMLVSPLVVFRLVPPEIVDTPNAPALARQKLTEMGPMNSHEIVTCCAMAVAVVFWVFGFGLPSAAGGMVGLSILLVTGVVEWKDVLAEGAGWSTLVWFSVLVGFSATLNDLNLIDWFAENTASTIKGLGLSNSGTIAVMVASYFFIHYFFASQTAHAASLFAAFLSMIVGAGGAGLPTTLLLGAITNLFGTITHYASGQSVIYYNAGYVSLAEFWRLGAALATVNTLVFVLVAYPWWTFIGIL